MNTDTTVYEQQSTGHYYTKGTLVRTIMIIITQYINNGTTNIQEEKKTEQEIHSMA